MWNDYTKSLTIKYISFFPLFSAFNLRLAPIVYRLIDAAFLSNFFDNLSGSSKVSGKDYQYFSYSEIITMCFVQYWEKWLTWKYSWKFMKNIHENSWKIFMKIHENIHENSWKYSWKFMKIFIEIIHDEYLLWIIYYSMEIFMKIVIEIIHENIHGKWKYAWKHSLNILWKYSLNNQPNLPYNSKAMGERTKWISEPYSTSKNTWN